MTTRKRSKKNECKLLVCDLDNTLYDWVSYFVPSIFAMIDVAADIMECQQEAIIADLKSVHQKYYNTEHPFALLETKTYLNWFNSKNLRSHDLIDPAFHAFNAKRKSSLKLYPRVIETLQEFKDRGVPIVAYSDSGYFGVLDRIRRLQIEGYFAKIYCSPRADEQAKIKSTRTNWSSTNVVELNNAPKKPNPKTLLRICSDANVDPWTTLYVGDSLVKDVWMANQADVNAAWAKYGAVIDGDLYKKLVTISHWTIADIEREKQSSELARLAMPNLICENGFDEILTFFDLDEETRLQKRSLSA
jgi:FMN phosphatase YigB (HAD superfamily)